MFGLRRPHRAPPGGAEPVPVSVGTIPAEFYGGKNPVVEFKTIHEEVTLGGEPASPRGSGISAGAGKRAGWSGRKRWLIIGGSVIFIGFLAGASWYYWRTAALPPAPLPPPPSLSLASPVPPPVSPPPPEVATTTPEPAAAPPLRPAEAARQFPPLFTTDAADLDQDGLTDPEEELFLTDAGVTDTDGDRYLDSHEIYNLYNPVGREPQKIIDSGLVKEFTNPAFGYALYYPANWAVGNVDANQRTVLFSTITGEFVEVRVFDLLPGEQFADWFTRAASGENFGELQEFASVFRARGWRRADYLVYYLVDPRRVYLMLYHPTEARLANYRTVGKLVARSFRLTVPASATLPELPLESPPATPVLPVIPSAATATPATTTPR
ncbi:MAG: hypothetical protein HYV42_03345 [Candidatus Magasanikbacteria bacterium]|nr:hypothetical protein [Candidatus Magasanikbacteria bacterium]